MNDINKKIRVIISSGEQKMKEIIAFFKDIFMLSDESSKTKMVWWKILQQIPTTDWAGWW